MNQHNNKIHISGDEMPRGFSLEDILAEYQAELAAQPAPEEDLGTRSKRIVMEALDQTISEASFSSIDQLIDETLSAEVAAAVEAAKAAEAAEKAEAQAREQAAAEAGAQAGEDQEELSTEEEPAVELTEREEEIIEGLTRRFQAQSSDGPREFELRELVDADERSLYASSDVAETDLPAGDLKSEQRKEAKERYLSPLVALMALIALRREQRVKAEKRRPTEEAEDREVPEMDPERATKLYTVQMRSLHMRAKLATAMSLVMVYLSLAYYNWMPLLGALKDPGILSLVLLIFELSVMVIGLDVITTGVMSLVRGQANFESLTAISCLLAAADAVVLYAGAMSDLGLPFCAVAALTLSCCLWGSYHTCKAYRSSFRLLAMSKKLYTVTGESDIVSNSVALMKSRRGIGGFVTRSEEADLSEYVYSVLTPVLLVMALVLGLLASVAHGQGRAVVHCVSGILSVSGAFSAALSFALPFSITARRLFQSGAAIAGWSGVRDIGKSRHMVITDSDVFPQGTVEIAGIRILEGALSDKIISYTGSVLAASGSGLAQPFTDLIRRNGYAVCRVENFCPHDGGGMIAMVNGENVYVGSTGFMNLMGIRIPRKLSAPNAVYVGINGALMGIFTIEYKPVGSVQDALALLLRSSREPIFAIRDFNITPMMIKKKFRMPTDIFEFPSYSERFRISGAEPDENSKIAAVISREGMGPLVDAADRGRRLYGAVRLSTAISAVGSVLGLVMMFLLCWMGAFDSATVSNALIFMLLWLVPLAVTSWGLQR